MELITFGKLLTMKAAATDRGWTSRITVGYEVGTGTEIMALRVNRGEMTSGWCEWRDGVFTRAQISRSGMVGWVSADSFVSMLNESPLDSRQLANVGSRA